MVKQTRLLWLPITFFFLFFALSALFNRYASDDFEFLYRLNELGFRGSVGYFYDSWNTRWTAISWLNLVFKFSNLVNTVAWYPVLSIALLWIAFHRVVMKLEMIDRSLKYLCSAFATVAFFYSCFSISDVFFWFNTSTMYLYGIIAAVFIAGEMLNFDRQFPGIVIIALCGIYIGGAYEPLAAVIIAASLLLFIISLKRITEPVTRNILLVKCAVLFFFASVSFLVSMAGEGHFIRATFLPHEPVTIQAWIFIKAMVKMMVFHLPQKLAVCLLFSFPWFLAGMNAAITINPVHLKAATIVLLILMACTLAPVVYIMSEMGPERSWTQFSLYLVCWCAFIAFYLGSCLKQNVRLTNALRIYVLLAALWVLATGVPNVMQAFRYRDAWEGRMAKLQILREQQTEGIVTLEPLPPSGWLHSAEISPDPAYFTNQHLRRYMGLSFDINTASERPDH